MSLQRRRLLQALPATLALPLRAWAAEGRTVAPGRFLLIFLRGGFDGLFAFAPQETRLAELRPTLSRALLAEGKALGQTGFTAHPGAADLAALYAAGELSFAPCAGTLDTSRSHFQAQDLFEIGSGAIHGRTGFMARAAAQLGAGSGAISFTREIPLAFRGGEIPPAVAPLSGSGLDLPQGRLLDAIRASHRGQATGEAMEQALATQAEIEMATGMEPRASRGAPGGNGLSSMMKTMGQILRGNRRMSLAFMDIGGVDTHANEEAALTRLLPALGEGLLTLRDTLGAEEWQRTRVAVLSEFGRTVRENGTRGTDHGHGGLCLLAGGALTGAGLLGGFDGLADGALNENRDLPVRADWRDLLASAMREPCGLDAAALDAVFPGRPRQSYRV
ncbi:MAG: DUF1501 domain-containing protein [Burkholderiales bacterium]|nr:DUF1501 domain-containing protein [Burkholderiales bacterium]